MNVTPTELSPTRYKLAVAFDAEETKTAEAKVITEIIGQAQLPGFRPGKAPVALVRQKFGRNIAGELQRALLQQAYEEAPKSLGMPLAAVVSVEPGPLKGGEPATIELTVDVQPKFDLPEYKGIPVEAPPVAVPDEAVEEQLQALRRQHAAFNVATREARPGDYVRVTYEGRIDGQPIAEIAPEEKLLGRQENTWEAAGEENEYSLGSITLGVIDMKAGDRKEITHTFAADFRVAALAGKTAVYSLEVVEVRERVLPEWTEDFLKTLKAGSVEEVKSQIYDSLQEQQTRNRQESIRGQVVNYLQDRLEIPLPESLLEEETQNVMRRIMKDNLARGVKYEEFENRKQELHDQSRSMAARRVKMDLILERIAAAEQIEPTNDDLSRAIYAESVREKIRPEQLVQELRKDQNRLHKLRQQTRAGKTLDFLVNAVTVHERAPERVSDTGA